MESRVPSPRSRPEPSRRMGDLLRRLGDRTRAVAAYQTAIEKYRNLSARWQMDYSLEIARIYNELGGICRRQGRRGQACRHYEQALELLGDLKPTSSAARRYEAVRSVYLLTWLTRSNSSLERAGLSASRALALLEDLIREDPDNGDYRHLMALFLLEAAPANSERAKAAVTMLEQLVSEYPDSPDFRYDLVITYSRGGKSLPGGPDGYLRRLRRARAHSERLVTEHEQVRDYLRAHLRVVHLLSRQLGRRPDAAHQLESEEVLRAAIKRLESLVSRRPDDVDYRFWLANTEDMLADRLLAQGALEEARRFADQSVSRLYSLPPSASNHSMLAASFATLARIHRAAERTGEAADAEDNAAYHRQQFRKTR